jgi:hypothetical protein
VRRQWVGEGENRGLGRLRGGGDGLEESRGGEVSRRRRQLCGGVAWKESRGRSGRSLGGGEEGGVRGGGFERIGLQIGWTRVGMNFIEIKIRVREQTLVTDICWPVTPIIKGNGR